MKTTAIIKELFGEILSLVLVVGILILLSKNVIAETDRSTLKEILLCIVFYFFGSSRGSANKSKTIDKVVEK